MLAAWQQHSNSLPLLLHSAGNNKFATCVIDHVPKADMLMLCTCCSQITSAHSPCTTQACAIVCSVLERAEWDVVRCAFEALLVMVQPKSTQSADAPADSIDTGMPPSHPALSSALLHSQWACK